MQADLYEVKLQVYTEQRYTITPYIIVGNTGQEPNIKMMISTYPYLYIFLTL